MFPENIFFINNMGTCFTHKSEWIRDKDSKHHGQKWKHFSILDKMTCAVCVFVGQRPGITFFETRKLFSGIKKQFRVRGFLLLQRFFVTFFQTSSSSCLFIFFFLAILVSILFPHTNYIHREREREKN